MKEIALRNNISRMLKKEPHKAALIAFQLAALADDVLLFDKEHKDWCLNVSKFEEREPTQAEVDQMVNELLKPNDQK